MSQRDFRPRRRHRAALAAEPLARAGLLVLVQQLAETRVALGLDADASGAVDRYLGILAEQAIVAASLPAGDGPFGDRIRVQREALRIDAHDAEPVLARIAHPSRQG